MLHILQVRGHKSLAIVYYGLELEVSRELAFKKKKNFYKNITFVIKEVLTR